MSMYDDLDPMFEPSPAAALDNVAARVHTLVVRRRMFIGGALGTFAFAIAMFTATFASGASGHTERISVAGTSTSTTAKGNGHGIS